MVTPISQNGLQLQALTIYHKYIYCPNQHTLKCIWTVHLCDPACGLSLWPFDHKHATCRPQIEVLSRKKHQSCISVWTTALWILWFEQNSRTRLLCEQTRRQQSKWNKWNADNSSCTSGDNDTHLQTRLDLLFTLLYHWSLLFCSTPTCTH